jgi:hypothetical protein
MATAESAKAAEWRERLLRFDGSGLTVSRFCAQEGVSESAFYEWRRRRSARTLGATDVSGRAFQPVVIAPSAFAAPALRVRLASGAEIDVAGDSLEVVRAVVGELARVEGACAAGEESSC